MGKRGPKPKGEYADKSAVLSTRISFELREALEAAAADSGHTLSREIEHRLRRTFGEDEKIEAVFGSERGYRLMQMIAVALQTAWNPKNPEADWQDDPVAFEMAVKIANNLLESMRPKGDRPQMDAFSEFATLEAPARLWQAIQAADASLPLNDTGRKHLANRIKASLGDLAKRPRIQIGTASQLRAMANEQDVRDKKSSRKRSKK